MTNNVPKLLTEKEVAEILDCCPKTVYNLRQRGKIGYVPVERGIRYDPRDVESYIERQRVPAMDDDLQI